MVRKVAGIDSYEIPAGQDKGTEHGCETEEG
jgi:hypothetical protein